MEIKIIEPSEIEKRSFEIISERLGKTNLSEGEELILKRVIHTTADFEYVNTLRISETALYSGINAIKNGCGIITDTNMALSGINKRVLEKFNCTVSCYVADSDVSEEAKKRGVTRSIVSMEKAARDSNNKIFVIGNAPTALIRLYELIKGDKLSPALVVGVPVGFVNVVESKELFKMLDVPYIISDGNKGGSNVAAAIINAIIYQI